MINALLKGVMKLVIGLVDVVLSPIDLLIKQFLPDLSTALSAIGSFFNLALQPIGFVVDMTGLSKEALSLIVLYYTFKLTVPVLVYAVKLAIRWYDKLKI